MQWLLHFLGIDTQQSYWYDFWSGIATQLSLITAAISIYKRHNCHKHFCWRIGKYHVGPYVVCSKHHPEHPKKVSLDHIQYAHHQEKKHGRH